MWLEQRQQACRRCSNYIFILDLAPGFSGLGKDNCETKRKTFKCWDLVRLILVVWQYMQTRSEFKLRFRRIFNTPTAPWQDRIVFRIEHGIDTFFCSARNFKTNRQLSNKLWANEISRYFILKICVLRNRTFYGNLKLKLCTRTQRHALNTCTTFQLWNWHCIFSRDYFGQLAKC